MYVRGQPEDYDRWAQLGNQGWSFNDVLPYFIKSEDNERGKSKWHGVGGYLKVSDLRLKRPIADAFVQATIQAGIPFNKDYNGEQQEGVAYFQQTTNKGFRCSTAKGFLKPALHRNNLTVWTDTSALRIVIENKKAVAVEFLQERAKNNCLCQCRNHLSCWSYWYSTNFTTFRYW